MSHRFNSAMSELSIQAVHEQPLYLNGKLAGLNLVLDVRVKHDIKLDRYGAPALDVLSGPQIIMAKAVNNSLMAPLEGYRKARLTKAEQPVESLSEIQLTSEGDPKPGANAVLRAGVYRSSRDFWLIGVEQQNGDSTPCRSDDKNLAWRTPRLPGASGAAMQATFETRFSLRDRLGYRYFRLDSPPLQFRYDHAAWTTTLAQLSIESCANRAEQMRLAAVAAEQAHNEQLYAEGSRQLREEDNPLYREICADDLGPLRQRLAAGVPPYPLSGKLWQCVISRPNLELFALLMPVIHARVDDNTEYCDTVRTLHSKRLLDHLATLVELKLPLVCAGARRNEWHGAVIPLDESGGQIWLPPAAQTYRWLQLLRAGAVPLSEPWEFGNLLTLYVAREPAATLELLLDAGCDPHPKPSRSLQLDGSERAAYSAAVWWAIRRITNGRAENLVAPIDPARIAGISRRMGNATAAELNAVDPVSGNNFLLDYGKYVFAEPALMQYLLSRGARLDVAPHFPRMSWYSPGYNASSGNELREKPMLAVMNKEQLRKLIAPRDVLDNTPAQPMPEIANFSPTGLGTYLCQRGVISCASDSPAR